MLSRRFQKLPTQLNTPNRFVPELVQISPNASDSQGLTRWTASAPIQLYALFFYALHSIISYFHVLDYWHKTSATRSYPKAERTCYCVIGSRWGGMFQCYLSAERVRQEATEWAGKGSWLLVWVWAMCGGLYRVIKDTEKLWASELSGPLLGRCSRNCVQLPTIQHLDSAWLGWLRTFINNYPVALLDLSNVLRTKVKRVISQGLQLLLSQSKLMGRNLLRPTCTIWGCIYTDWPLYLICFEAWCFPCGLDLKRNPVPHSLPCCTTMFLQ